MQKDPQPSKRWIFRNYTQRPQSSSFLGLAYRILNMNPQKEPLWGLWAEESQSKEPESNLADLPNQGSDIAS